MARRTRSRSTRSSYRRGSGRTSTRRYAAPRRTSARRSTRRTSGVGRTVRIVIEQPNQNPVSRPELIGKMPISGLTRTRSRF